MLSVTQVDPSNIRGAAPNNDVSALLACLRLQVEWGADEGLADLPLNRTAVRDADQKSASAPSLSPPQLVAPAAAAPISDRPRTPAAARSAQIAASIGSLADLRTAIENFDGSPLRDTAGRVALSAGVPTSAVMVIGDAPEAEDDRRGEAFTGPAGQMLDRMLASIGLDRQHNCYLANIVPYRPPGGRPLSEGDLAPFLPFALRHIELAGPRLVVLAGGIAAKSLLRTRQSISQLRGAWRTLALGNGQTLPALAMLHPSQVGQVPGSRREAWEDLLRIRARLDEILGAS